LDFQSSLSVIIEWERTNKNMFEIESEDFVEFHLLFAPSCSKQNDGGITSTTFQRSKYREEKKALKDFL